ncbi:MAG TPA: helix-turn-helix domain-containing protein [Anaerolineae bacterium]|nr:helix-turn-helix domain-containing protein [Anaerolineae bacterium]
MTEQNEDKDRLIALAEAAELYGFSHVYLTELARKGRLAARKLGGVWLTTPSDMEVFIRSRQKKGVFRDDINLEN